MIGISMGDANGVGPEILLRAFQAGKLPGDFIVVGDLSALRKCDAMLDLRTPFNVLKNSAGFHGGAINIYDAKRLSEEDLTPGDIDRKVGEAALCYIKESALLALKGEIQAIVTLPVNKEGYPTDREGLQRAHPGISRTFAEPKTIR